MHLRTFSLNDPLKMVHRSTAIDNYPELEWEDGGYGDFKQFDFVRDRVE